MTRRWGIAAVIAGAVLWLHGAFALSSWADGWVMTEQYDALPTGCLTMLMMGLLALAALYDGWKRRSRGGPSSWLRPPVRAFFGAGVLTITAVVYGLPFRLAHPISFLIQCLWRSLRIGFFSAAVWGERITFLLVVTGVLFLLWKGSPQRWPSAWAGRKTGHGLMRLFLLTGLAVALHVVWVALMLIGPDLLIAPFGYRSFCGYVTCYWVRVAGKLQWPDAMSIARALDLFSAAMLLLWPFQRLWLLTMKECISHPAPLARPVRGPQ